MPTRRQVLKFPRLLNARDLGGHETRDGSQTRWKAFVRTDDLGLLTPEATLAVAGYGVRTVIDLRWSRETQTKPHPFLEHRHGVRYLHISLLGENEDHWLTCCPADVTKEMWGCVVLDHAQDGIRNVMRAIASAPAGGVLFHCYAGKDRTGVIAALLLALADVRPELIAADYTASTQYLRDGWLAAAPPEEHQKILEHLRCPEEHVHNLLTHLDSEYRGPIEYLRHLGLSRQEILGIRMRLRG